MKLQIFSNLVLLNKCHLPRLFLKTQKSFLPSTFLLFCSVHVIRVFFCFMFLFPERKVKAAIHHWESSIHACMLGFHRK